MRLATWLFSRKHIIVKSRRQLIFHDFINRVRDRAALTGFVFYAIKLLLWRRLLLFKATNELKFWRNKLWIYESLPTLNTVRTVPWDNWELQWNVQSLISLQVAEHRWDSIIASLLVLQPHLSSQVMMRFVEQFRLLNFSALQVFNPAQFLLRIFLSCLWDRSLEMLLMDYFKDLLCYYNGKFNQTIFET